MDIDFDELERASLQHSIYDTDQLDPNPFWYRESLNSGYDFRLGPRDPELPQPSCRFDQDESGDFDPSAKRLPQLVPVKRKREPAPPQLDENGEPVPRKPRQVTWQFGRFNGLSLPITLKLTSSRGLQLLAKGTDNWPADDEPESSTHSSIFTSASVGTSNTSNENCADPYVFRQRDKAYYGEHDQPDVDDELDLSKITLGHPAARGCIPCLKLRLPCPLLEEGATLHASVHAKDAVDVASHALISTQSLIIASHVVHVSPFTKNVSPVLQTAGLVLGHPSIKPMLLILSKHHLNSRLVAASSTVPNVAKPRDGAPSAPARKAPVT
ncbi:MAG: hypothetical protein Q9223_004026, partial [Gallowayella weberi]